MLFKSYTFTEKVAWEFGGRFQLGEVMKELGSCKEKAQKKAAWWPGDGGKQCRKYQNQK